MKPRPRDLADVPILPAKGAAAVPEPIPLPSPAPARARKPARANRTEEPELLARAPPPRDNLVHATMRWPGDMHRQLQRHAYERDVKIAELVREAVEEWLKRQRR